MKTAFKFLQDNRFFFNIILSIFDRFLIKFLGIIISFILVIILASSCSLEKRLAKYCPLCVQKDSTITIIQVRDTTITIPG